MIPPRRRPADQRVLWKQVEPRGKPTKVPVRIDDTPAKSNDPATWAPFAEVKGAFDPKRHDGPGFVFRADDPFTGIDLDGCRDPKTGAVSEWAKEIVLKLDSYAEVSPSGTGVKIFVRGESPFATGRKIELPNAERVCEKQPAIELYNRGRYFAVTGLRLQGPAEPTDATGSLAWLKARYWPDEPKQPTIDFHSADAVVERARKYLYGETAAGDQWTVGAQRALSRRVRAGARVRVGRGRRGRAAPRVEHRVPTALVGEGHRPQGARGREAARGAAVTCGTSRL